MKKNIQVALQYGSYMLLLNCHTWMWSKNSWLGQCELGALLCVKRWSSVRIVKSSCRPGTLGLSFCDTPHGSHIPLVCADTSLAKRLVLGVWQRWKNILLLCCPDDAYLRHTTVQHKYLFLQPYSHVEFYHP